jgi:hypothetical protein
MLVMIAYKKFADVTITGILTKSRHYKKTFVTLSSNVGPHNMTWDVGSLV